jgi:hypothetical protein
MTMKVRAITIANVAVAALASAILFASGANAIPNGGGFGGGFKPGSISKPIGPVKSFPVGPIKAGPFKPLPTGPYKPKGPIVTGPIKPLPAPAPAPTKTGGHGHGKYWAWAGVTILASQYDGCGYEYYKWKSTGSSYWHAQYAECRGW